MLAAFRNFAKSPFAVVLLSLLIVSFAIWGIRDVFHGRISNAVVTAGSREVTPAEFKRMFNLGLKQIEQRQGQPVSLQDAVAGGFDQQILNDLSGAEAFDEFVHRMGVIPADSLVGDAIAKQPDFFNKITGRFDKDAYQRTLAENDLTPDKFETIERDQIAENHLAAGIGAGLRAPKTYGAMVAGYEFESRNLTFFMLSPGNVAKPEPPTDAQLQAFLNAHAAALKLPERRVLSVVRFSAQAMAGSMPADPAAVEKLYNFRKDTASTPEKRSLVQIPVKDAAAAAAVVAKLNQGQDPAAVAKSINVSPISYQETAQSGVADPKVADAAFAMKAGEVKGPIQGALGLAVVKVTDIKPAHQATLEEMRPTLEAQVKKDAAGQKVFDAVQKYQDSHASGSNLAEAAKASGGVVMQIGPITAEGMNPSDAGGAPPQGLTPKLLSEAFKLPQGGETDMENEASGEYFAVRVEKVIPPSVPALAEIKPRLMQAYMIDQITSRLQAKADEALARLKKGETMEAIAASMGAQAQHAQGLTRATLGQNRALGPEAAGKILAAKAGETFSTLTAQAIMVARLDSIQAPPAAQMAPLVLRGEQPLSQQLFDDMGQLMRSAAIAKIKPTIDQARAREALGLSADTTPASSGKGTPKS
ncbi:peptidyl-prolyl cis-trans isomerase [Phenylobacterium montanum]|uniref:Parvulin-like PPIase n=1 Tax=Phenylobacterium montanum TaxID=2823693 RepID=A0A975G210_9CAUL|nr:peptidyl-prolyl cis-trans isomerase [Caulobacter sp. S6]QUD88541.1 peptidyl-prolyl cis-trans isomerase [Caulobacter sp. S6]